MSTLSPQLSPSSPSRGVSFAFPPDRRRARTVQVSAYGDLSWSQEASDQRSRPSRQHGSPLRSVSATLAATLAPISEEHKDQRGTARLRAQLHAPYTQSSLGPRRLPPLEALDDLSGLPDFGRRRERRERPAYMPQAMSISTPAFPEGRCSETPSPRTPSPPVTPETHDIDTRVCENMDDLNRKFAKELCI
ncbi:hypothetical protein CspeluHIS016_0202340 [Cutaneotrichosporon spelunceum]|uniref:Uncharacterized protein n=1 Tax=Cutaneotrichosporon spelunceum TaxID=1672016 RepID=A0AAD3YAM0_9TREE|nr:hypothetical protein CspeluHIS016_0202340 [Cutaneotrichosporon spelunceum]